MCNLRKGSAMKKILKNIWMKIFVTILCMASILSTTICGIGMIGLAQYTGEDEIRQAVYERLSKNYEVEVLYKLYQTDYYELNRPQQEMLYHSFDRPNWHYALIKTPISDGYQLEKTQVLAEGTYLHGNSDVWKHTPKYMHGTYVNGSVYEWNYDVNNIYRALFTYPYIWVEPPEGTWKTSGVEGMVYCMTEKQFYFGLADGTHIPVEKFTATYFNGRGFYCRDYVLEDDGNYVSINTYTKMEYDVAADQEENEENEEIIEEVYDVPEPDVSDEYDDGMFHLEDPQLIGVEIDSSLPEILFVNHISSLMQRYGESALDWYTQTPNQSFGEIMQSNKPQNVADSYDSTPVEGMISYYVPAALENEEYYWVVSYVDEDIKEGDLFYEVQPYLEVIYGFYHYQIAWLLLSVAILIASVVYLGAAAGRSKKSEELVLRWYDKIPYGIFLAILTVIESVAVAVLCGLLDVLAYQTINYAVILFFLIVDIIIMGFFVLGGIISTVVRIRSRQFFRYTIGYWIYKPCRFLAQKIKILHKRTTANINEHMPLFMRILLLLIGTELLEVFFVIIGWAMEPEIGIVVAVLSELLKLGFILWCVLQFGRLQKGSERIAAGDLSNPIDTNGLMWDFKKLAQNINQVGDGIGVAVEQQMKSERFRTELITNVSHDIKTPLTSIINYVDLIKKEPMDNPVFIEYVDVLDRQSSRLKKLIEDLMEASKASTGNIAVNLEPCDVHVLLTQMLGEYAEKAEKNHLTLVEDFSPEEMYIMADSRHIWRVIDNLLNNICKYAMEGTRVYVSMFPKNGNVFLVFKNISKTQLNISSEELMERFVRGDSSRNTEGSGLGLSIAQSLTILMNGEMKLDIDGDLFKVTLQFPQKTF